MNQLHKTTYWDQLNFVSQMDELLQSKNCQWYGMVEKKELHPTILYNFRKDWGQVSHYLGKTSQSL